MTVSHKVCTNSHHTLLRDCAINTRRDLIYLDGRSATSGKFRRPSSKLSTGSGYPNCQDKGDFPKEKKSKETQAYACI